MSLSIAKTRSREKERAKQIKLLQGQLWRAQKRNEGLREWNHQLTQQIERLKKQATNKK